ncbi:PRD domain-containing protein [Salibacterium salarium]|uniref:PRD domain-containing protein n=1 Tax=Salibacterium salarium TaxID=284579 RepID=A0A428N0E7_9BACI|nr:PRD domain-containing protein [Salibacterium salarium]
MGGEQVKILRVLNNNAVVVKHGELEKIIFGAGIGFQKGKNDPVNQQKIEKIFSMEENTPKFEQLLKTLPLEVIEMGEEIISYAEGEMHLPLSDHVHISIIDHLAFALERIKQGFPIENKLLHEIKALYQEEFRIGLWAVQKIKKDLDIELPEDEAGHIALHLHTAKLQTGSMEDTMQRTSLIQDLIQIVEERANLELSEQGMSYHRLVVHLNFALSRAEEEKVFDDMDPDMLDLVQTKYKKAYDIAYEIANYVRQETGLPFPLPEIGYIALHIQRILSNQSMS